MKPLYVGTRIAALVAILLLSYYVGRPVYWEAMSRAVQGYGHAVEFVPVSDTIKNPVDHDPDASSDLVIENDQSDNSELDPRSSGKAVNGNGQEKKQVNEEKPKDLKKFMSHEVLQRPIWDAPPKGTKLPPVQAFSLSREMIEFRAAKNVIVVTFANHAFEDFVLTWVRHLTDVGVSNLLIGAMDRVLLEDLFWKGVPVFDIGSEMNTADVGWGTPTFHKMGREKVYLINEILDLGYEVLFCDTDMVWVKNPLPYIEGYPDADILVSSDAVVATVEDDSLENWRKSYSALNIGIFHWRPTASAKKFAADWKILLEDEKIWDQNGFNDLIQIGERSPVDPDDDRGLFYAFNRTLKVGILPVSIFCSGHTYFVQGLHKQLALEPYAVHTTFQFAGTEGKRHRLREGKLFYDKPEYYTKPGGFMTFNASIPKELLEGGKHTVETHFALVNYQMKQVRDALAVASALNRTLVMPPLWCRFDRLWFGHPGILPDTKTPQPFLCPMDHIFEVSIMLKDMPESEFGPMIDFREYSFLDNPRLPQKVKASKLVIRPCNGECLSDPSKGIIEMSSNRTDEQLILELRQHKNRQVIEFSSMKNVFGGFVDKEREHKFRRRVRRYTGIWCCLENLQRGHIYYDIYWDQKPNWKPLPPTRPEDDHPPFD